jgi:hypothetical protein
MAVGALVTLVAAGAVVGFAGGSSTTSTTTAPGAARVNDSAAAGAAGDGLATKAQIAPVPPDGGGGSGVVPGSPRIVRSADLRVKVAKGGFGAAFDRVASVAAANGGFVSSSSTAGWAWSRASRSGARTSAASSSTTTPG